MTQFMLRNDLWVSTDRSGPFDSSFDNPSCRHLSSRARNNSFWAASAFLAEVTDQAPLGIFTDRHVGDAVLKVAPTPDQTGR